MPVAVGRSRETSCGCRERTSVRNRRGGAPVARGSGRHADGASVRRWLANFGIAFAIILGCVASALAQETPPAPPADLATQAAVALGLDTVPAAAPTVSPATPPLSADPAEKDKDSEDEAGEGGGIIDFFRTTELTGFVDAYYSWNFNHTNPTQLRNFDVNHNEFSFNLAEVALEKKPTADSRIGFRMDFDAGPTAGLVNAFEPGGADYLDNFQQGYASVLAPVGKGLQIDFGKFVTPHGAEVIETRDNWNYSRGLLFALAIPYYHMGARFAYPVAEKVSLTGYVVNGWNNVRDNNSAKTVGATIAVKPNDRLSITQNYMVGAEQPDNNDDVRHLFDTVVSYTLTPKVSIMGNYDYGRDRVAGEPLDWTGIATYLKYQHNEWFAVVPRFEVLWDSNAFMTGTPQTVKEFTLTGEYKFKGLVSRLEYRTDFSDEPFFTNGDGLRKDQTTLTFGVLYAFTSAKQ
jgi:hypothetical protein